MQMRGRSPSARTRHTAVHLPTRETLPLRKLVGRARQRPAPKGSQARVARDERHPAGALPAQYVRDKRSARKLKGPESSSASP